MHNMLHNKLYILEVGEFFNDMKITKVLNLHS